ncbi:type II toxin-antitoxin system VapB family antitoxin [Rhizobium sp. NRK18]|uniref:type II toxin-antitoxin system VapB family antitoxin n=1 Tax=Rhizobium sp. NRK18 TaxID=2964667 RepID=UPI0021C3670C|nr:type II toxin-antitoxin system VapB family antitoxin [Rhizobium sp. NRK18]MCQ2005848.1 type II toxin-antitoxin system VapB family antitoxin [Rhizobium sp. NRK18]
MALSIKDPETERLARMLASRTGESITEATRKAIEDRLKRLGSNVQLDTILRDKLDVIRSRFARMPIDDRRSADEILGYDDDGLPG